MNKLMSCQEAAWYVSSSRRHQWNFRISRLPLGARLGVCSRCPSIDAFFFPAETHGKVRSAIEFVAPMGPFAAPNVLHSAAVLEPRAFAATLRAIGGSEASRQYEPACN